MRILMIEDDRRLASLMKTVLEDEKYNVDHASEGDTGLELALRDTYDLIIVDWMLPGRDGLSICRTIRAARVHSAVLMLTARGQVEDRVAGLESGADDYLVKPFAFDELIARLHALSRRFNNGAGSTDELRSGDLVMDIKAHTARRAQSTLDLTKKEWDMLEYFMRNPNQTLSRQSILDYVWSYDRSVQPEMVDVYISYLRQKLKADGREDLIHTVRGFGYRFEGKDA
ncbi:MAG TPA: DNA-binding response regulator [Anaerolineaceae bacterium]|jgi:DNA-binding response OmpR family regulator|nr:DNA-binding response regulator [Anaerolineaceae bacterium]